MYFLFVKCYLLYRPASGASHYAQYASHLQNSYIVILCNYLLTTRESVVLYVLGYSIGVVMSARNRKYRSMTVMEICDDFIFKSNSGIQSLLRHYKISGDNQMLVKLKTAYSLAKIERAKLKLKEREDEITANLAK